LLRARRLPARERLCPERRRIDRHERLGKHDELGALPRRLGRHLLEFVERRLAVEHDGLDLHACDFDRTLHAQSLLRRTVAAAAGRLNPDDVAGVELPGQLGRLLLAVDECAAARTLLSAGPARRRVAPTLGEQREPAVPGHAQLADDAIAASVSAGPARTEP